MLLTAAIAQHAQAADTQGFFNLLTRPELLSVVEDQLPEYRERHYPPTLTLSMFLGQVMSADGWCQNAVNEHNGGSVGNGLPALSLETDRYCTARKRLPQGLAQALVQETGRRLDAHAPGVGCGKTGTLSESMVPRSAWPIPKIIEHIIPNTATRLKARAFPWLGRWG